MRTGQAVWVQNSSDYHGKTGRGIILGQDNEVVGDECPWWSVELENGETICVNEPSLTIIADDDAVTVSSRHPAGPACHSVVDDEEVGEIRAHVLADDQEPPIEPAEQSREVALVAAAEDLDKTTPTKDTNHSDCHDDGLNSGDEVEEFAHCLKLGQCFKLPSILPNSAIRPPTVKGMKAAAEAWLSSHALLDAAQLTA